MATPEKREDVEGLERCAREALAQAIAPDAFAFGFQPERGAVRNDVDAACDAARTKAAAILAPLLEELRQAQEGRDAARMQVHVFISERNEANARAQAAEEQRKALMEAVKEALAVLRDVVRFARIPAPLSGQRYTTIPPSIVRMAGGAADRLAASLCEGSNPSDGSAS